MSPASNNEPALPVNQTDLSAADDAADPAILCEDGNGKLPGAHLRRDIASGQAVDTSGLIRFVVSPDGELVPDLAQKLPGRGMWVACDRQSLDLAARKHIFSKAARRQVKTAPNLSEQVHGLLRRRCLDLMGLARREGAIINGFEKTLAAVKSGKCAWLIEASDGAADGRNKLLAAVRMQAQLQPGAVKVCGSFGNAELSLALGQENAIHAALVTGRRVQRWSFEMKRLSGFEPLMPPQWGSAAEQT